MNIKARWKSGSISVWDTTFLTSGNGEDIAAGEEFLDISEPERIGIILMRRYFSFAKKDIKRFCEDDEAEQKVLVTPEEIDGLLLLQVDGEIALERVIYDDEGNPQLAMEGTIVNMLIPPRMVSEMGDAAAEDDADGPDDSDFEPEDSE